VVELVCTAHAKERQNTLRLHKIYCSTLYQQLWKKSEEFEKLAPHFPQRPGTRSIIRIRLHRITDSCGFGVPYYEYIGERDVLENWAKHKGEDGVAEYQAQKNAVSIDGLPALVN
jgi:hypothetical protein